MFPSSILVTLFLSSCLGTALRYTEEDGFELNGRMPAAAVPRVVYAAEVHDAREDWLAFCQQNPEYPTCLPSFSGRRDPQPLVGYERYYVGLADQWYGAYQRAGEHQTLYNALEAVKLERDGALLRATAAEDSARILMNNPPAGDSD